MRCVGNQTNRCMYNLVHIAWLMEYRRTFNWLPKLCWKFSVGLLQVYGKIEHCIYFWYEYNFIVPWYLETTVTFVFKNVNSFWKVWLVAIICWKRNIRYQFCKWLLNPNSRHVTSIQMTRYDDSLLQLAGLLYHHSIIKYIY